MTPRPIKGLGEQRRILAKVEQLMVMVDALETQFFAFSDIRATYLTTFVVEIAAENQNANQTRHLDSRAKTDAVIDNDAAQ